MGQFESNGRVMLEVGHGGIPIFYSTQWSGEAGDYFDGAHYIGIDTDERATDRAKGFLRREESVLASIGLHTCSLAGLELPDNSVDEVFIANVFAETRVRQEADGSMLRLAELNIILQMKNLFESLDRERELRNRTNLELGAGGVYDQFLEEIKVLPRIMKPGAQLTVIESNTPTPALKVVNVLESIRMIPTDIIERGEDERWAEVTDRFTINVIDRDSYVITAENSLVTASNL